MHRARTALALLPFGLLAAMLHFGPASGQAQELRAREGGGPPSPVAEPVPNSEVMSAVVVGVKSGEHALYLYERIERVESRKDAGDAKPQNVRVARVVPAGTGIARIPLGLDGRPADANAYLDELVKLLNSLTWASEPGQSQREAYQKIQKKQKDRDELIDSMDRAFLFTFVDSEPRGDRTLLKYRMEPNPTFKSTNRATSMFSKIKGMVWVDSSEHQLARVEGEVTDDISIGVFVAKVRKGSRFMQDRYEMAPGLWLPSFTQYDFDGRKLFSNFSIHEKTFYSSYKKIGTPAEAIPQIQSEIAELNLARSKSAEVR